MSEKQLSTKRQLRLGLILQGAAGNMSAWRHKNVVPDASINFGFVLDAVKKPNKENLISSSWLTACISTKIHPAFSQSL